MTICFNYGNYTFFWTDAKFIPRIGEHVYCDTYKRACKVSDVEYNQNGTYVTIHLT